MSKTPVSASAGKQQEFPAITKLTKTNYLPNNPPSRRFKKKKYFLTHMAETT
jgi:hypothetical protein